MPTTKSQNPDKWQQIHALDEADNIIILLVHAGGNSCSYLAQVLGISNAAVTQRIQVLARYGLVDSIDNSQKYFKRRYVLTERGETLAKSMNLVANLINLNWQRTFA